MGLIYKHTFNNSNKSYIGLTKYTMEERLKGHLKAVKNGSALHFHNAIRKYGVENIISEILEDNIEIKNLTDKEIFYIDKFDTFLNGYNMTLGGEGNFGLEHSNEAKQKISEANKGYKVVVNKITRKTLKIKVEDFDNELYDTFMKGKINVYNKKAGEHIIVSLNYFNNNRKDFITNYENKVVVRDGLEIKVVSTEDFKSGDFESIHKNKSTFKDKNGKTYNIDKDSKLISELGLVGINDGIGNYIDECGNKIRLSTKEAKLRNLKGINTGTFHKECAKNILIYDEKGIIRYKCFGNFATVCKENGLPPTAFGDSYRAKGEKLYENLTHNSSISRLKNKNYWRFKGWSAKLSEDVK